MKKLSLLFFISFFCMSIIAQRVNLDNEHFKYHFRHLPEYALDDSYLTFSVGVNKTEALEVYSSETACDKISIDGRKKIPSEGHIRVNVDLNDLIIEKTDVSTRSEVKKDKEGNVLSTKYFYTFYMNYTFDAKANVIDYKGEDITSYVLKRRSSMSTYKSKEFSSRKDAYDYYLNNKLEIKTSVIRSEIDNALKLLNDKLKWDFSYYSQWSNEKLIVIGSKKHEEYLAGKENYENLIRILESITANEIPSNVYDDIKPIIDYYEGLCNKYVNKEDKFEKKIIHSSLFNLAAIYFYTEQYDKAIEYADKIIALDESKKEGEKIKDDIEKERANFAKHGINTNHFVRDIDNAQGPI